MDDNQSFNTKFAENESVSENRSIISEINVGQQENKEHKEVEFDLERINIMDEDMDQQDELNKKLGAVKRDLSVKIPASYVNTAGFAPVFNTQIGSTKRSVKSFLSGKPIGTAGTLTGRSPHSGSFTAR